MPGRFGPLAMESFAHGTHPHLSGFGTLACPFRSGVLMSCPPQCSVEPCCNTELTVAPGQQGKGCTTDHATSPCWVLGVNIVSKVCCFQWGILRCILQSRPKSSMTHGQKWQREYKITSGLCRKVLWYAFARQMLGGKLRRLGGPWSNVGFFFFFPKAYQNCASYLYTQEGPIFQHVKIFTSRASGKPFLQSLRYALPSPNSGLFHSVTITGKAEPLSSNIKQDLSLFIFPWKTQGFVNSTVESLQKSENLSGSFAV